jgi:hypothetical protein
MKWKNTALSEEFQNPIERGKVDIAHTHTRHHDLIFLFPACHSKVAYRFSVCSFVWSFIHPLGFTSRKLLFRGRWLDSFQIVGYLIMMSSWSYYLAEHSFPWTQYFLSKYLVIYGIVLELDNRLLQSLKYVEERNVIVKTFVDNTMTNRIRTKGQTMIYKALHRKINIE